MEMEYGVLFDMDGVIVDTNPYHLEALIIFCKKHGKNLSEEEIKRNIYGTPNKQWVPKLFGKITPQEVAELGSEKEQIFRDLYKGHAVPLNGLERFLKEIKEANVKTAVCTSAPLENATFILGETNLEGYFDTILHEGSIQKGKPDPEVFIKGANALGLSSEDCIVIEDSLSGVKAGLSSGSKVIGVTTTHTKEELASTHLVINDFEALTSRSIKELIEKNN